MITFKCVKSFIVDSGVKYTELAVTKFIQDHPMYKTHLASGDIFEHANKLIINAELFDSLYVNLIWAHPINGSGNTITETPSMKKLLTATYKPGGRDNTVFKNATEILINLGWTQLRKVDTVEMARTLRACGFTQTQRKVNGGVKKGYALLPIGNHDNAPHGTYTINR